MIGLIGAAAAPFNRRLVRTTPRADGHRTNSLTGYRTDGRDAGTRAGGRPAGSPDGRLTRTASPGAGALERGRCGPQPQPFAGGGEIERALHREMRYRVPGQPGRVWPPGQAPGGFGHAGQDPRGAYRQGAYPRREATGGEELPQCVADRDRLGIGDVVDTGRCVGAAGEKCGRHQIVHGRQRLACPAVADHPQGTAAYRVEYPGQQGTVARAVDGVRAQDDGRRGDVHEPRARERGHDVPGTVKVRPPDRGRRTPVGDRPGGMHHDIHLGRINESSCIDVPPVVDRAGNGELPAAEGVHLPAGGHGGPAHRTADEAGGAGYRDPHRCSRIRRSAARSGLLVRPVTGTAGTTTTSSGSAPPSTRRGRADRTASARTCGGPPGSVGTTARTTRSSPDPSGKPTNTACATPSSRAIVGS